MKHDKILYDKTEIIVVDETGKRPALLNLTYDKIISISFDKCKEGLSATFREDFDHGSRKGKAAGVFQRQRGTGEV